MTPEVHIALVHHPVLNKAGDIVATAVTNLDIHDNARSARTYRVASYHIVTPLDAQVELVSRILGHWRDGFGARRVPNRVDAMNLVRVSRALEEVVAEIERSSGRRPIVVATAARRLPGSATYGALRERMHREPGPWLIVFGTGYGLAGSIVDAADVLLEPIGDPADWNHLSVRAATAITLDRLLGS